MKTKSKTSTKCGCKTLKAMKVYSAEEIKQLVEKANVIKLKGKLEWLESPSKFVLTDGSVIYVRDSLNNWIAKSLRDNAVSNFGSNSHMADVITDTVNHFPVMPYKSGEYSFLKSVQSNPFKTIKF